MAKVGKRLLDLGSGSDQLNDSVLPITHSQSNYTPSNSNLDGHLSGIDSKLADINSTTGDLQLTSFSLANGQSTAADVIGLTFTNGTTRSAQVQYSIVVDASADLFEEGTLRLIQKGTDWFISRTSIGDDSLVDFDVTTSGQVQYRTTTYAGFSSATLKFRAITTTV